MEFTLGKAGEGMHNHYSPFTPVYPKDNRKQIRENRIEVNGEGTISAAPDQVEVIIGIVTENEHVSEAQQQNAAKADAIINSLIQLGIPKINIQSSDYQINPVYNFKENQQILVGYRVQHLFKILVDDITRIGAVIDQAVQQGANSIPSITFMVKHPELYYNQALQIAIGNGIQKAKTISSTLGIVLSSSPVQVIELSRMPHPLQVKAVQYAQAAAATPIEPGRLQITANVNMKFHFFS